MEELKKKNVLIVGAGVAGLSTSYYLAKAGGSLCVFYRDSIIAELWKRREGQSARLPAVREELLLAFERVRRCKRRCQQDISCSVCVPSSSTV